MKTFHLIARSIFTTLSALLFSLFVARSIVYADLGLSEKQIADLITREKQLDAQIAATPDQPALYNSRGRVRYELGNFNGAVADYNQAAALNPRDALTFHRRCYTLDEMGQGDAAMADCSRALELDPSYDNAYIMRGNLRLKKKDYSGAVDDYRRALSLNQVSMLAYFNLTVALNETKNYAATAEVCKIGKAVAENLGSSSPQLLAAQDVGTAPNLDVSLPYDPKLGNFFNNCSVSARNLGSAELGVEYALKAIAEDPDHSLAYLNLGRAKYDLHDADGARRDYEKAIELDPLNSGAYYSRAELKHDEQDPGGALRDYNRAHELDPNFYEAYWGAGSMSYELGKFEDAVDYFDKAIAKKADVSDLYVARAMTKLSLNRTSEADADIAKALELAPNSHSALNLQMSVYKARGDAAGVKEIAKKLGDAKVESAGGNCEKAAAFTALGKYEDAFDEAGKAVERSRKTACGYWYRGMSKAYLREYSAAHGYFEQAASLEPENLLIQFVMAFSNLRLGRLRAAETSFNHSFSDPKQIPQAFHRTAHCSFAFDPRERRIKFFYDRCPTMGGFLELLTFLSGARISETDGLSLQ